MVSRSHAVYIEYGRPDRAVSGRGLNMHLLLFAVASFFVYGYLEGGNAYAEERDKKMAGRRGIKEL